MSRFVRPETCTLTLADGATLTVKTRLSSGEQRTAYAHMYRAGPDGEWRVDPIAAGLAMVTAYLVDWSLSDDTGAVVPIRGLSVEALMTVLDALAPEDFAEVRTAIETHVAAKTAEREQAKNARDGERALSATSPSPSGPV